MKSLNIALFLIFLIISQVYTDDVKNINQTHTENIFIENPKSPISYTVTTVPNPLLSKIKLEKIKNLKCIEKTGVLNFMKGRKKNVLLVKPTFISLTSQSINFFDSFDKN